ncbi:glycoside hydrolase family 16 [Sphingobium chlorophenolicum L-1]|uniref:Glycoside hydrolase family 16 n=1 Tax=Sphingobium chlorophenolicum L-1 TaxID=690566 RepID=F6F2Z2_SPHCR|nr:family 16 glycosylhydrolase [Sphingobium chlorophenolicum]AEG50804.1 glycoside hydrolase family 16 [Sphingobium chlorophenolicum L-1]
MRIFSFRPLAGALFACTLIFCLSEWGLSLTADTERIAAPAPAAKGRPGAAAILTNGFFGQTKGPSPEIALSSPLPSPWTTALGSSNPAALFPSSTARHAPAGPSPWAPSPKIATASLSLAAATTAQATDFANFDFAGGTRYPELATASVGPAFYRPGSTVAYVPISLDRPTPNTVIARVMTEDGTGLVRGIAGVNYQSIYKAVIFRPGDPLTKTVSVPILLGVPQADFIVRFVEAPWGGKMGTDRAFVQCDFQQAPTAEQTAGRDPRSFQPSGTLQWKMSRETLKWSDAGHDKAWSTKLPNGRSQPGNQETGIYLDGWVYRDYGIEAPLRYTDEGLIMHTQKLREPISWDGVPYHYGAIVLSGHNTRPVQIGYGQYEFTAKMPTRRGSWPAFWLISTAGWPPEIDIYEGFGFESWWDFDRYTANTLHGGANITRTFQQGVFMNTDEIYGIGGFTTGFHSFAVDIQPDYITWFIDGQETYQAVNPFAGFRWYPIMNVAVKTTGDYADGTGDMIVKDVKIYSDGG